jgi:hypothetical protein
MEDFHGTLTKYDKSELLLQCIQEHRRLYPDCKKETLKKKFQLIKIHNIILRK